jgi:hypothetical protein
MRVVKKTFLYTGCNKSKVNKKISKSEYGKLFSDYLQAGGKKQELFLEKGKTCCIIGQEICSGQGTRVYNCTNNRVRGFDFV